MKYIASACAAALLFCGCSVPRYRGSVPAASGGAVTFAHITDLHAKDGYSAGLVAAALGDLERMRPKPDFVMSTGDNVNKGERGGEVEAYLAAVSTLAVPYFTVPGNHDLYGTAAEMPGGMGKEQYFSFDAGAFHFSALSAFGRDASQPAWFAEDAGKAARAGRKTVIFSHDIPGRGGPQGRELREKALALKGDMLGFFAGHWHANRVFYDEGLPTFITPPPAFGGIDGSPAGFRIVKLTPPGTMDWEFLPSGMKGLAGYSSYYSAADGTYNLIARFHDSAVEADSARLEYDGGSITLSKTSRYAFQVSLPPGGVPAAGKIVFYSGRRQAGTVEYAKPARATYGAAPRSAWETFHRDAARTGQTPDAQGPVLNLAWAADTGATPFSNSPVYSGGRVYAAAAAWSSAVKPNLSAYDAETGALLWRAELPSNPGHSPTVSGSLVTVLTVNGELCAYVPSDGKLISVQRPAAPVAKVHTPGATAPYGARHIGGSRYHMEYADAAGGGGTLYAASDVDDWVGTLMTPAVSGDRAVIGTLWRDGMWIVDLARSSAAPLGRITEAYGAAPVLDGDRLYVAADAKLSAYEISTGKLLWSAPGFEKSVSTPALDKEEGAVYAIDGEWRLAKVRAADGEVLWRTAFAEPCGLAAVPYRYAGSQAVSSPAVAGRCVWTADLSGNVFCIGRDGKILGRFGLGSPTASSPAVSGNAVFISALDGYLYALAGDAK